MEIDRDELLTLLKGKPRPERIATLRSLYRMNQTALAEVADVARTTVSTWETPYAHAGTGRVHEPGKMARQRMGAFFGLPAYVFSDEWGDEPAPLKKRGNKKRSPQNEPVIVVPTIKRIVTPTMRRSNERSS